jgi:enoyl-CoA hydratase
MTIWDLLKPVVAKVHGFCLAGGSELMSLCDIAFVADDAVIGYPPMRGMTTPDTLYFAWKMPMSWAKYLQLTGNSVTGKQAAEMGWVVKSFPAESLDEEVMKELRPMSTIAPDLLAANKLSLNQSYEIMGFRTALSMGAQWHALSAQLRPNAGEFGKISREQGLRAAIAWRDGAFQELEPPRGS